MKKIQGLSVVAIALVASSAVFAASPKFGLVDMQRAMLEVKKGKAAKAQLEKAIEAKKKDLDQEQEAIRKESDDFQKKSAALSEKARMEKGMKLQQRIGAWQESVAKTQAEFQGKEAEASRPIIEGIRALVPEIARSRNLDAVFEAQTGGLIWAMDKTDITEELIKKYDEKNPK